MKTFNNFAELCATQNNTTTNIAMFFDSDLAQRDSFAEPAIVENAYSAEEEQRRVNLCEQQMASIQAEMDQIEAYLTDMRKRGQKANSPQRRNIQRPNPPINQVQQTEKQDRFSELKIRFDALDNRIQQLQDNDSTGQFVKQCHAIEEKIKAFRSQIGQTVDKPNAQQTAFPTRNEVEQEINPPLAFLGITGSQCTLSDASNEKDYRCD